MGTTCYSQETLNSNTEFIDGIYLSCQDFMTNRPSLADGYYTYQETKSSNSMMRFLYNIKVDSTNENIKEKAIWGICIKGRPFINTNVMRKNYSDQAKINQFNPVGKRAITFTRFVIIGRMCYFVLSGKDLPFSIANLNLYNIIIPIPLKNEFAINIVLDLDSKQVYKLGYDQVLELIKTDPGMYSKYYNIKTHQMNDQTALKMIWEYNNKYPVEIN